MVSKALAIHCVALGATVLAFTGCRAALAQLPDAPSAVLARQPWAIMEQPIEVERGEAAQWPQTQSSSSTVADGQWAFLTKNAASEPQESLYRPRRQSAYGLPFATAEQRPVPGAGPALENACPPDACSPAQSIMCCGNAPSPFVRYLNSPDAVPLTARDNLNSAVRNVADPFNLLTIAADAAIGVASDPDSAYGPGAQGMAKYAGVSLTEDMTGEFFGTFLIPSLVHQDPHYHRVPFLPIRRRILHAVAQVVWARSYTGKPMFNYGNIVGGIATAIVSNTFVPGPGRQGFANTSQRLALAFAISPSGNLIEEFLPDIASKVNLRVVIFQRILNMVSKEESGIQ